MKITKKLKIQIKIKTGNVYKVLSNYIGTKKGMLAFFFIIIKHTGVICIININNLKYSNE